ncbi:hypothetical protein [Sporomusa sphaeroides]|nr:hypothetical protein [Sporomusa sphaeroides]
MPAIQAAINQETPKITLPGRLAAAIFRKAGSRRAICRSLETSG